MASEDVPRRVYIYHTTVRYQWGRLFESNLVNLYQNRKRLAKINQRLAQQGA
ncbi:MAG: hypothetical protein ABR987_21025 [Terracidiphilus sp.]|jgi:hypothetical protein